MFQSKGCGYLSVKSNGKLLYTIPNLRSMGRPCNFRYCLLVLLIGHLWIKEGYDFEETASDLGVFRKDWRSICDLKTLGGGVYDWFISKKL